MNNNSLKAKIEKLLGEADRILARHGGRVKLIEVSPEGVVKLELQGACAHCSAAKQTFEHGLKEMLMLQIEEITDVIAVNLGNPLHPPPGEPLDFSSYK